MMAKQCRREKKGSASVVLLCIYGTDLYLQLATYVVWFDT